MLSQCFINELDIYLYMDYDMKVLIERRINMPIGIITDCLCVFIGGIIGTVFGKHMSLDFKEKAQYDLWSLCFCHQYFKYHTDEKYACSYTGCSNRKYNRYIDAFW